MSKGYIKKFKDKQILSRLKRKDREAFVIAYDENVSEINRFVYFKVGSREEANDLTSSIFLKAWNHVQNKNLLEAKTLKALLYKIARTTIIDHYRAKGSHQEVSFEGSTNDDGELLGGQEFIVDETNDQQALEQRIDNQEQMRLVNAKLPLLKEEYRELIIMRFVNDLSLNEIADITQKGKGNIRVTLHRALKALKELIEEEEEEAKRG